MTAIQTKPTLLHATLQSLSTGQKLQSLGKLISFLFQVEDDVTQMVKFIAEQALGSAPMFLHYQRLALMQPLPSQEDSAQS